MSVEKKLEKALAKVKSYKEAIAELTSNHLALHNRVYQLDDIVEVKYKCMSSLEKMVNKVMCTKESEAKTFWVEGLKDMWVLINFIDKMIVNTNELEKINGDLSSVNKKMLEKIRSLETEVITLSEQLNKTL